MKIVEPSFEIMVCPTQEQIVSVLALAARNCYKSEGRSCYKDDLKLLKTCWDNRHYSIFEHVSLTIRFVSCRGFTHELVRHRLAVYSQESTRYCNYSAGCFNNEITVLRPYWEEDARSSADAWGKNTSEMLSLWFNHMQNTEKVYLRLIELGLPPQAARGVLPIDLKTEVVMTCNLREWHYIIGLRGLNPAAHPDMHRLMLPLLDELHIRVPIVFDDLWEEWRGRKAL